MNEMNKNFESSANEMLVKMKKKKLKAVLPKLQKKISPLFLFRTLVLKGLQILKLFRTWNRDLKTFSTIPITVIIWYFPTFPHLPTKENHFHFESIRKRVVNNWLSNPNYVFYEATKGLNSSRERFSKLE